VLPSEKDKVSFLSQPEHYPGQSASVTVIETHHARVFLTDEFAYKLKKPSRYDHLDLSSAEARHLLCAEEIRLNRLLARRVYIGLVTLVVLEDGSLALDAQGEIVDWLVKMQRLPGEWMLDKAAKRGLIGIADIERLMLTLQPFYELAAPCMSDHGSYCDHLMKEIHFVNKELEKPQFVLSPQSVAGVVRGLEAYIAANENLLESRRTDHRIRDIHGDLRPEHISFAPGRGVEIIDRVEFDANLRCLDCVEELAYLGLECRAIGQSWIERDIMHVYEATFGDDVPRHLWHFYAARRALTRTMLCAWHSLDGSAKHKWLARAVEYLDFATDYQTSLANDR